MKAGCTGVDAILSGADTTARLIETVLAHESVGRMRDVAGMLRLS